MTLSSFFGHFLGYPTDADINLLAHIQIYAGTQKHTSIELNTLKMELYLKKKFVPNLILVRSSSTWVYFFIFFIIIIRNLI